MVAVKTLKARVIPSLLLRNGRLVKGQKFSQHLDAGHPATTARVHNAQGADEIILLDIDASREHRRPDLGWIERVAEECFMPLAAGGGIRSVEDAKAVIDAGADKVVVNGGAIDCPRLLTDIALVFGAQAVVAAVDVVEESNGFKIYDHRKHRATDRDALRWIGEAVANGAGEIRICAVDREGTRSGFNLDLLSQAHQSVCVPIIIEGGAGSLTDVDAALKAGADGVALGTMLVFSDNNIVKVRRFLAQGGHSVRV
jgi:cyclase